MGSRCKNVCPPKHGLHEINGEKTLLLHTCFALFYLACRLAGGEIEKQRQEGKKYHNESIILKIILVC